MVRPTDEQPPPVPTEGPAIWPLVIKDMEERGAYLGLALRGLVIDDMRQRDLLGRARYGTPLQAGNGRDALADGYQEALDLAVYLRQAREEESGAGRLYACYVDALGLVGRLRSLLFERDGR